MKQKLIVKYISIIFILATFMGFLHHHNDIQEHNDCKMCTIQNNLTNIDTPVEVSYLTSIFTPSESLPNPLPSFEKKRLISTNTARAPPITS